MDQFRFSENNIVLDQYLATEKFLQYALKNSNLKMLAAFSVKHCSAKTPLSLLIYCDGIASENESAKAEGIRSSSIP